MKKDAQGRARERVRAGLAPVRIAWLVASVSYDQASVRYRCAHPLANLAWRGLPQEVFLEPRKLAERLAEFDVVIAVKRFDADLLPLAARCAEEGRGFYVDLCDDVISADGRSSQRLLPQAVLRALGPLVSGFLCPTPAMQFRIHDHLRANGLANAQVHVMPDCAETDDVYRLSAATWTRIPGTAAKSPAPPPADEALPVLEPVRTRLTWFGNWGGPHSDFGLSSLLPVIGLLNRYENRHEVALHVMSNHADLADLLQRRARFPLVYHPWSRTHLAALLGQTNFVLVTSGEDQFSTIKSPNRALLALAAGVPVIVERGAEAASELWVDSSQMPVTDRIVDLLDEARECGHPSVRARLLADVMPALGRFRIERIGARYAELLQPHASGPLAPPVPQAPMRIAHVFGNDEDLDLALRIRGWCERAGVEFLAIASLSALRARKNLFSALAEHGIKPSIVVESEAAADDTRRLRGAQIVVQASSDRFGAGALVAAWSSRRGVPLMSQGEFIYRYLRD